MKRKTWITLITVVTLAIAIILYALARRYLIEEVELDLSQLQTSQQEQHVQQSEESDNRIETPDEESITIDDWNYEDSNINLAITKHEQGEGEEQITYYVADVKLKDQSLLKTALANNQFGRNIIDYTTNIAAENNAIFAINGDYYGFRSDGIVIRNGMLLRDEGVRDGVAVYSDGTMKSYEETNVTGEELVSAGALHTFSFGPILVENGEAIQSFDSVSIDKNFGNRSIQSSNPRTGIAWIDANHYLFVVVDGRSTGYSKGMTLNEFALLFEELGATTAYNLDGGGSSTMVFRGEIVNNPLGRNKEREVSDIIYIGYE